MAGREPEEAVRLPMLHQRWRHVSFLHWRYDPDVVAGRLPPGVDVDTFDGWAWVGLTPFVVEAARPPGLPAVPRVSTFPETNLRTYVVGPDGRDGLAFLTLEADSLCTTVGARVGLGVPYRWADMRVDAGTAQVEYHSRRRSDPAIGHRLVVRRDGDAVAGDPLVDWLTGRWRAWTRIARRWMAVPVRHEPWPLCGAIAVEVDETLTAAAGLPPPEVPPLVHFSPGVHATLGWPSPARA